MGFHIYRKRRATELERCAKMDKEWDEKIAHHEFQDRRAQLMEADEAKAAKNHEKRQRKKQRKNASACPVNRFAGCENFLATAKELVQSAKQSGEVTAKQMSSVENIIVHE